MEALISVAMKPASSARDPSRARSPRRDGAIALAISLWREYARRPEPESASVV